MEIFATTAATYSTQTSNDAYPIGNGRLAAMIYGGVAQEIIQFNDDTVWAGQPRDYSRVGAVNSLATIRNYVWLGQGKNAYDLVAKNTFMSSPLRQSPYQPTANLRLNFTHPAFAAYRRSLNLDTAIAKVEYTSGGVTYTRECFASFPDQVIVVRLTASQPGALGFQYSFDSQHTATTVSTSGTDLILDGKVNKDANTARQQVSDVRFRARAKITTEGGTVSTLGSSVIVSDATSATLVLGVASNFVRYNDLSGDPVARTTATLATVATKTHADLLAAHLADYQPLFRRVQLDLNSTHKSTLETSARLQQLRNAALGFSGDAQHAPGAAALAQDTQLVALNFQMARYLYIAGSRPGSQPLTLQGKWNNEMDPAWESKMTLNINQEMNYWGVEMMNLPECHLPMVELTRDLSETGATVAQRHYGAAGWMVHHNTDLWRGAAPINNPGGLWPSGGAWLSMHLWSHYLHTRDPAYLAEVYPLMKGAAQFFVDFLVVDPRSGRTPYLLTNPSHSPEQPNPALGDNGELVAGTTMDNQLIRELFTGVISAGEVLGLDADFRATLAAKRALLPPNTIGRLGQIQEWLEDVDVASTHRHLSPLLGLFPADQISPVYEPALAAAGKVLLDWKGDATNNTSWSQAWKMCLRNTLYDGNRAFTILANLLRTSHSNNLTFSIKGLENQIDGNLGSAAGIGLFFLQNTRGEIHLLPALPASIPQGSVTGLRSPGAFTVGITWAGGQLTRAIIHSDKGGPCRIRSATPVHVLCNGTVVPVTTPTANVYEFSTTAGADYAILPGAVSTADTDNDGLPDTLETALSGLGLDPLVDSSAWLALLTQNGPSLGLFTREQLLRSVIGQTLMQRTPGGDFVVKVRVERSEDLAAWNALDLAGEAVVAPGGAGLRFALSSARVKEFYRFTLRDVFTAPGPTLPAVAPADADGDGIPDATETNLASMGFAIGVDSSALRQQLLNHAAALGLFTETAVRGLRLAGPAGFQKAADGAVSFYLSVALADSGATGWMPAALQASDLSITGAELQLRLPADPAIEYHLLHASL
jgi:alpha-L-fucosidase 2